MPDQVKLPSEEQFKSFVSELKGFRSTLSPDHQQMFDTMVRAAFRHDDEKDVEGYWWAARGPEGNVAVGAHPEWFAEPVYIGTPWASYYYP